MTNLYKKYIGGYDFFEYDSLKSYLFFKIPFIILLCVLFCTDSFVTNIAAYILVTALILKVVISRREGNTVGDCALIYFASVIFFASGRVEYTQVIIISLLELDLLFTIFFAVVDTKYDLNFSPLSSRYRFIFQKKKGEISAGDIIMLSKGENSPAEAVVLDGEGGAVSLIFENSRQRKLQKDSKVFSGDSITDGNIKVSLLNCPAESIGAKMIGSIKEATKNDMEKFRYFSVFRVVCIVAMAVLFLVFGKAYLANICAVTFLACSVFTRGVFFLFSAAKSLILARRGFYSENTVEISPLFDKDVREKTEGHIKLTRAVIWSIFAVSFAIAVFLGRILPVFCGVFAALLLSYIAIIKLPDIKNERTTQDEET